MKFAICHEMFGDPIAAETFQLIREIGYTGVELAPFTFMPDKEQFDIRDVPAATFRQVRRHAEEAGLEIVGMHWLLAKTNGLYLTSPVAEVQRETAAYFKALINCCAELGGKILVLGSPQQRNLLPGITHEAAEAHAAAVLSAVMPLCERLGVTIALEPLSPAEGDFMLTATSGIRLAERIDSPNCQLHLDVKAMSSEDTPILDIMSASREWMVHFHANDPNLLGPGMGDVRFQPIIQKLGDLQYDGWISVEVFIYEPSPEEIARISLENMQACL